MLDVQTAVRASFEKAHRAPIRLRDQALREASFRVPREIAKLNPEAQQFRLEDMGPMYPLPKGTEAGRRIDTKKNACAFLYFPNGAVKATAAFVAINAEFKPPNERWLDPAIARKGKEENIGILVAGMVAWYIQYEIWSGLRPDITGRIQSGELPVIISFRHIACGALHHIESGDYTNPASVALMMDLTKIAG
ncbi:hypothetical protein INS49_013517 [Diaporthe citri]|uniref:uncharacterized protein n=1 Tax=Diaporthe citri TaxID=83186 RepID=UPI001C8018AB|nr:uncharacterized protein INS49_013517 [Diaporthe citri]KAG6357640.1 hypothetical protein INS49_013517 [Diaporthe citri]